MQTNTNTNVRKHGLFIYISTGALRRWMDGPAGGAAGGGSVTGSFMVMLRKRDTKGKFTTSPAGKCLESGPDAPWRSARINPNSAGIMNRIVKASQGRSPGGRDQAVRVG